MLKRSFPYAYRKRVRFLSVSLFLIIFFFYGSCQLFAADTTSADAPGKKSSPQAIQQPVIDESVEPVKHAPQRKYGDIPILSEEQTDTLDKSSTQGDHIPYVDEEHQVQLDELQKKGSVLVIGAAEWIDSFFDDPRYLAEENRTRAKVKLGLGYSKLYELETYSSIDLRVSLPRLEGKANVFLRMNDDSDFEADSSPIPNTVGGDKNDNEPLTAGVQYFLTAGEKYNISTEAGLSLDYVYGGLRYRHLHSLFSDEWTGRFTNRIRWYSDDGWEDKASYDIEKFFGERFLSRTIFTGLVSEATDGLPFSGITRLFQVIDIDTAISYDVAAYFNTKPEFELTDFQIRFRYRQRFFRDWLVLELTPQITFPAEYDHEFNPGIITKFEFDFGYLGDRKTYDSIFEF